METCLTRYRVNPVPQLNKQCQYFIQGYCTTAEKFLWKMKYVVKDIQFMFIRCKTSVNYVILCFYVYSILLCDFTKRQYWQLEVAYNNVFRRLMGYDKYCSASGMFVANRTDGFNARVRKLVYGFRERLDISDNSLIETVINSSAWRSSKFLRLWEWEDYLYWP